MIYEELLAKINEGMQKYGECTPFACDDPDNPNFCAWKALRAVVELHKPEKHYDEILCSCDPYGEYGEYPCETIKVIEKELA